MVGGAVDLPPSIFDLVPLNLRVVGDGFAEYAMAYILFHEIGPT